MRNEITDHRDHSLHFTTLLLIGKSFQYGYKNARSLKIYPIPPSRDSRYFLIVNVPARRAAPRTIARCRLPRRDFPAREIIGRIYYTYLVQRHLHHRRAEVIAFRARRSLRIISRARSYMQMIYE